LQVLLQEQPQLARQVGELQQLVQVLQVLELQLVRLVPALNLWQRHRR
jgi:hypothetical protein